VNEFLSRRLPIAFKGLIRYDVTGYELIMSQTEREDWEENRVYASVGLKTKCFLHTYTHTRLTVIVFESPPSLICCHSDSSKSCASVPKETSRNTLRSLSGEKKHWRFTAFSPYNKSKCLMVNLSLSDQCLGYYTCLTQIVQYVNFQNVLYHFAVNQSIPSLFIIFS